MMIFPHADHCVPVPPRDGVLLPRRRSAFSCHSGHDAGRVTPWRTKDVLLQLMDAATGTGTIFGTGVFCAVGLCIHYVSDGTALDIYMLRSPDYFMGLILVMNIITKMSLHFTETCARFPFEFVYNILIITGIGEVLQVAWCRAITTRKGLFS